MTDENFDDSQTKLIKHFSNGLTRNLILWIISKEKIHGYGIMKKLDEFFLKIWTATSKTHQAKSIRF